MNEPQAALTMQVAADLLQSNDWTIIPPSADELTWHNYYKVACGELQVSPRARTMRQAAYHLGDGLCIRILDAHGFKVEHNPQARRGKAFVLRRDDRWLGAGENLFALLSNVMESKPELLDEHFQVLELASLLADDPRWVVDTLLSASSGVELALLAGDYPDHDQELADDDKAPDGAQGDEDDDDDQGDEDDDEEEDQDGDVVDLSPRVSRRPR